MGQSLGPITNICMFSTVLSKYKQINSVLLPWRLGQGVMNFDYFVYHDKYWQSFFISFLYYFYIHTAINNGQCNTVLFAGICSPFNVNCLLTSKHELRNIRFDVQTGEERHRALTFINFFLQSAQFCVHSLCKTYKNT